MYPDRDTLSNVPRSGYMTARDQSTRESGETEGGTNTARSCHWLPVFFFMNEHNNNMKPQAKKQRFPNLSQKRKKELVEEKDADDIRKVLCKIIIHSVVLRTKFVFL